MGNSAANTAPLLGVFCGSKRFRQFEQAFAHLRIADPIVGPHEFERFSAREGIRVERCLRLVRHAGGANAVIAHYPVSHVIEEEGDRDIENAAKLEQPGSTDPIGASLVFLDLLKC